MNKKKKEQRPQKKLAIRATHKIIFYVCLALLLLVAISMAMLPLIRLLMTEDGQAIVTERMQKFGFFLPLAFVILQVLQVVIAVIPGGPMPLIGEALFGKMGALFLCLTGFFCGTVLVYYLVQWIGKPLVDKFVSEEHFQKFDFLTKGKRLTLLILLVFLLPGLPKDMLTYLVSFNSKIKPMHLFILTTLGRTPATVLTIFMSDSIWEGNYGTAITLAIALIGLAILGFFIKQYIDRRVEKQKQEDYTDGNKK